MSSPIWAQSSGGSFNPSETELMSENLEWVWAEVLGINKDSRELSVRYIDYVADEEKQMSISVTEKCEFEGVESFAGIRVGDYISVDYEVNAGKNEAVSIMVERYDQEIDIEETED